MPKDLDSFLLKNLAHKLLCNKVIPASRAGMTCGVSFK